MRALLFRVLIAALSVGNIGHAQHNNGSRFSSSTTTAAAGTVTTHTKSISSSGRVSTASILGNKTCPSRTANYITHTLAQQCLRTDRVQTNATQSSANSTIPVSIADSLRGSPDSTSVAATSPASTTEGASGGTAPADWNGSSTSLSGTTTEPSTVSSTSDPVVSTIAEESDSPLDNANFLSFEEWKKIAMAKYAEQSGDLHQRAERQRPGINNALDGFGEDGEIELDFAGFGGAADAPQQRSSANRGAKDVATAPKAPPTSQVARSKDAGKTCKERSNYASFDCAANVLKHNREIKSALSVLVENKDSYMLNICSAENKFFIVELCDTILVDTVVLANYEFFSSIFRHFRVSASGIYPAKTEEWAELGTFEARSTREVQPFLIEHPQIWAKYLRIEFLTHYGSEYYCPVSLLRVHGTTMLDDLRTHVDVPPVDGMDGIGGNEEAKLGIEGTVEEPEGSLKDVSPEVREKATESEMRSIPTITGVNTTASTTTTSSSTAVVTSSSESNKTDSRSVQSLTGIPKLTSGNTTAMMCPSDAMHSGDDAPISANATTIVSEEATVAIDASTSQPSKQTASSTALLPKVKESSSIESSTPFIGPTMSKGTPSPESASSQNSTTTVAVQSPSASPSASASASTSPLSVSSSVSSRNSATASVPPPPQPSTQESFFKSIHKRLQQLESNSTLSLQYIEEQSRILRDAFSKVEKRQISATTSFLTNLNETVMVELRGFRQAYDQLWQSTVIELDGQREQYQREMLAMSSRLTLVADELVWQKRMGIVQSTLLLLCLGLVLFARGGSSAGYIEVPLMQAMMNKSAVALGGGAWDSPPGSPSPQSRSPVSLFRRRPWRSVTDPSGSNITDGIHSGTDSRPESKEGPPLAGLPVDVNVEPPTPPQDSSEEEEDEEVLDPRGSQSSPATPRGTREKDVSGEGYLDAG